jgi:FtsP/CotA-like multicopper oxidase with cupredoxin domain
VPDQHNSPDPGEFFPQNVDGLPDVQPSRAVALDDGEAFVLRIGPVRKNIAGNHVRMLAYNGSIPGPLLRVQQGTTVTVEVANDADLDQTIHWHGLRLENRFDGVPHQTQEPIVTGGRFTYELQFPDPGLYWYHPHIREDYSQEMGLYGQIIVEPTDPEYWPRVNREIALTLDDVLLENDHIPAFRRSGPTHTMMGRFGTVLLVAGETDPSYEVTQGEVVRLLLTNTANTRVFNVVLPGAELKLVGGDSGRHEHEEMIDSVIVSPSERAIVDVLFNRPGTAVLKHRTPQDTYPLATFHVHAGFASPSHSGAYHELRSDPSLLAEREALAGYRDRAPDKTLQFVGEMHMSDVHMGSMEHHDHAMSGTNDHAMGDHGMEHAHHADPGDDGIEWEDTMAEMNVASDLSNMTWKIVDAATGMANDEIFWRLRVGDRVKICLDNSVPSDHPMHHPFHIHGGGRFLVLDRDGVPESNLVWKDTVLVRAGEVVNIVFDVTNPGRWMAHCHIAEHSESGMMFNFEVDAATRPE